MSAPPDMLGLSYSVTEHGYVSVVDTLGSDSLLCKAIRQQYGSVENPPTRIDDRMLIRSRIRNGQLDFLQHAVIQVRVSAPALVAWGWPGFGRCAVHLQQYDEKRRPVRDVGLGAPYLASSPISEDDALLSAMNGSLDEYEGLVSDGMNEAEAIAALPLGVYCSWTGTNTALELLNAIRYSRSVGPLTGRELPLGLPTAYAEALVAIVRAWLPVTFAEFMEAHGTQTTVTEAAFLSKVLGAIGDQYAAGLCAMSGLTTSDFDSLLTKLSRR